MLLEEKAGAARSADGVGGRVRSWCLDNEPGSPVPLPLGIMPETSTITPGYYARKKRICESENLLGEESKEEYFETPHFRRDWWRFCLAGFAQRLFRKPVSESQHFPKTVRPRVPRTPRRPDWKDKLWPGLV